MDIHIAENDLNGALTIALPSGQNCYVFPHKDQWQGFVRFGLNNVKTVVFNDRDDATNAIINHVRAHLQRDLLSADVFLGGYDFDWFVSDVDVKAYEITLMSDTTLRVVEAESGWYGEAYLRPSDEDPFLITELQPDREAAQRAIVKQYTERLHGDLNQLRGNE